MAGGKKYLVVLAGPTAVGKTDLTIELAQRFNTVVLSADSRQFFREMSIGTAKPDESQLKQVRHYFINSHSVQEDYSVGSYEADALNLLKELFLTNDVVFVTGGSGLYIKALCDGLDQVPAVAPELRDELNRIYEQEGLQVLLEELKVKDPDYFSVVDRQNPRRVIRALEIIRCTGGTYSALRSGHIAERDFEAVKILLNRDREELYHRIDLRVDQMMAAGLEQEAKSMYQFKDKAALQTVGYSELFSYFDGNYDIEEAVRLIKRNTRRYAKRQLTWFRREEGFKTFHPDEKEQIVSCIFSRME